MRNVITPYFKITLIIVLLIFVVSLSTRVVLAFILGDATSQQDSAIETVDWVLKISIGLLIGLLAGKAL